ncbi:MAG: hypothetical protein NZ919_03005 [Candidatus Caldarchaeum sp.]|nr:hypothetical protein [Candidatus Caldarchaeum sp.]
MDEYVSQAGGAVRLKLVHVKHAQPEAFLTRKEVELFPGLPEALEQTRHRASTDVYPQQFEALNPSPVVAVLKTEDISLLDKLIKTRRGKSLYESAALVEVDGEKYLMAVEHHCG